jgi:hypothetical protein
MKFNRLKIKMLKIYEANKIVGAFKQNKLVGRKEIIIFMYNIYRFFSKFE